MLEVGDAAPTFTLTSDAGKAVKLSDFAGKTVVVYFYPRNDTPGCTVEAKDFSAAVERFRAAGVEVVGISRDTVASHCRFRDKYSLGFTLLSDPDLTAHKAYGAWGEKLLYGKRSEGVLRSTFVVGKTGKIEQALRSVKVPGHVERVLGLVTGATAAPDVKAPKAKAPAKSKKPAAR